MAAPVPRVLVDWGGEGRFDGPSDAVHPLDDPPLSWTRGRSGDFTSDARGELSLSLDNADHAFTPDRNWADGGSDPGAGAAAWSALPVPGLTADAGPALAVPPPLAGPAPWESAVVSGYASAAAVAAAADDGPSVAVACSGGLDEMALARLPGLFRRGQAYRADALLRLASGSGQADLVLGSASDGGNRAATSGLPVGAEWAPWTLSWTPSADCADAALAVKAHGAVAVEVRIRDARVGAVALSRAADAPAGAGPWCAEAALPAAAGAGAVLPVRGPFRAGRPYSLSLWLRSPAGAAAVEAGIGAVVADGAVSADQSLALGMPADALVPDLALAATSAGPSWARSEAVWTPLRDAPAAWVFLRSAGTAAAVRAAAVQVNPGASPNDWIEAPTRGQLAPGRAVRLSALWEGAEWPLFTGRVERLTPDPGAQAVVLTASDELRRLGEVSVAVPGGQLVGRSVRDLRTAVLADAERGHPNLCSNGSLAASLAGWDDTSFPRLRPRRVAGSGPPPVAAWPACAEIDAPDTTGFDRVAHHVRLAPLFFPGESYRVTAWVRSEGSPVALGASMAASYADAVEAVARPGPSWQRLSLVFTVAGGAPVPASEDAAAARRLSVHVRPLSSSPLPVRFGAVSVTRGAEDLPWEAVGPGRWPSWCGNGAMGSLNGWWTHFDPAGAADDFEGSDGGWWPGDAALYDAGTASFGACTGVSRSSADAHGGSWSLSAAANASGQAAARSLGPLRAGDAVSASAWVKGAPLGPAKLSLALGDPARGPSSVVEGTRVAADSTWRLATVSAVLPADAADLRLLLVMRNAGLGALIDDVSVSAVRPDAPSTGADTRLVPAARFGSAGAEWDAPAQGGARRYGFAHSGAFFPAGRPFSASAWVRPSTGAPVRITLGAAGDSASADAWCPAGAWTRVAVAWTPAASWACPPASPPGPVLLTVGQSDAEPRVLGLSAVRVTPTAVPDDFEPPWWAVAREAEPEAAATDAWMSGPAAAQLAALNALTLARHWIRPTASPPFWAYAVADRDSFARASAAERIESMAAQSAPEVDREPVANLVGVQAGPGWAWATDPESAADYGPRPRQVQGSGLLASPAGGLDAARALVARYARPVRRPSATVVNRFPSQLARDVGDLVWADIDAWMVRDLYASIATATTTVSDAGQRWTTTWQLEESPLPDAGAGALASAMPEA